MYDSAKNNSAYIVTVMLPCQVNFLLHFQYKLLCRLVNHPFHKGNLNEFTHDKTKIFVTFIVNIELHNPEKIYQDSIRVVRST